MPELPEVEIVKQSLEKNIENKQIKKVIVNNPNLRFILSKDFSPPYTKCSSPVQELFL